MAQGTGRLCPFRAILAIFFTVLLFAGLIVFILWLSLRPHHPKFRIQEFSISTSISGLDQSLQINSQITFNVTVRNPNVRIGILYESVTGWVYYKGQLVGSAVVLGPVYQGPKNTMVLYRVLSGPTLGSGNAPGWSELANDRAQGPVGFRLELRSSMQYRKCLWDTKHHHLHPKCDVVVGSDGVMLPRYKNIKCPL